MFTIISFFTKILSYAFGRIVEINYPSFLNNIILSFYVKLFDIDVSLASKPLNEYKSLSEFFIRDLKPNLRPLGDNIVSPVDGSLKNSGFLNDENNSFKIKSSIYKLSDLVNLAYLEDKTKNDYKNTSFFNFYLSPKDYHHIHSPFDCRITHFEHIPGSLFSVGDLCQKYIPFLFARNERLAVYMESDEYTIILVIVAAYNVGSIETHFTNFRSGLLKETPGIKHYFKEPIEIKKGERIGTFHLGSSVVLFVTDKNNSSKKDIISSEVSVKYGESLFK